MRTFKEIEKLIKGAYFNEFSPAKGERVVYEKIQGVKQIYNGMLALIGENGDYARGVAPLTCEELEHLLDGNALIRKPKGHIQTLSFNKVRKGGKT